MNLDVFYRQLPTLYTRRLALRKLRVEDANAYIAFASDPKVTKYLRWEPHSSIGETKSYLAEVEDEYRQGSDGPWGIEMAQTHQLIGVIHLMNLNPHDLNADVGIVLHSHYWQKGIGSEALDCVLDFCFRELCLQRVQGMAIVGNIAACRIRKSAG